MSTVSKILAIKTGQIVSVSPETKVFDAIEKMSKRSAGTALVMDDDQLVGIISERDFIRKIYLKKEYGKGVPVKDIMTTSLTTVSSGDELDDCMSAMTSKRIRHLPVVDDGKVVGVISIGDIVKYLVEEKNLQIKTLWNYISSPGL